VAFLRVLAVPLLLSLQGAAPASSSAPPLQVKASFDSGDHLSFRGSWNLSLSDPGSVALHVSGLGESTPRNLTVPAARIKALRDAIEEERFFALRDDYGDRIVDGPQRRMTIRLGMVEKTVVLRPYGQPSKAQSGEVDRAMKVWFAIRDCIGNVPEAGS
jgi:hypothetical protein